MLCVTVNYKGRGVCVSSSSLKGKESQERDGNAFQGMKGVFWTLTGNISYYRLFFLTLSPPPKLL